MVFLHDANKICLPWDETKGQVTGVKPNGDNVGGLWWMEGPKSCIPGALYWK